MAIPGRKQILLEILKSQLPKEAIVYGGGVKALRHADPGNGVSVDIENVGIIKADALIGADGTWSRSGVANITPPPPKFLPIGV